MFAKLFDNISPRKLLNALAFIFLLGLSFWVYPSADTLWYPVSELNWPLLNSWGTFISFSVVAIGASLLFAESINRRHVFEGQYLSLLIAGVLFWVWLYPLDAATELWSMPLFAFFTLHLLPLLEPKARHAGRNFGSGFLVAIAGFIHGNAIFLLLLPIGLSLAMRSFNGRSLMALILGYGACLYLAFSLDYFFETDLISRWTTNFTSLDLFVFQRDYQRLVPLVLLALFLALSILINASQGHHLNSEQRQHLNFWIYFVLVGSAGFLLFDNADFWLGLILFPAANLGAQAIQQIQNPWLKDSLLLLPFLAYLSFFFFP